MQMPAALSNSTSPATSIRPRSGRSSPAIISRMLVLPAPERPSSAVSPLGASKRAAMCLPPLSGAPRCNSTSTLNATGSENALSEDALSKDALSKDMAPPGRIAPTGTPPYQHFGSKQRRQRYQHRNDRQPDHLGFTARGLQACENRQRQRFGFARNAGDEGDGGAELPDRPGKAQHQPGQQPRHGERQG